MVIRSNWFSYMDFCQAPSSLEEAKESWHAHGDAHHGTAHGAC